MEPKTCGLAAPEGGVQMSRAAAALSRASAARHVNPHRLFDWPSRPDPDRMAMSEELVSLFAHPIWSSLSDEQRWRAALLETGHFFSLNLRAERELMAGLSARLHQRGLLSSATEYLFHFIQEEAEHSSVFSRFCNTYLGFTYPDRQARSPGHLLPGEEEFTFFAQMLVFEHLASWHNAQHAGDLDVWPLARSIHEYHAADEARHLAFGRLVVEELWQRHSRSWGDEGRARVGASLKRYLEDLQKLYVSPSVYRDLGLEDPLGLRAEVLALPSHKNVELAASARVVAFLRRLPGMALV